MTATTTEAAADALRDAVSDATRPLSSAVTAVKEAQRRLAIADHISDAIGAAASMILAIEALEDAAKGTAAAARERLRDAMIEGGCWILGGDSLTVSLADAPRAVVVTDKAALMASRPDLFTTPEPAPDRKRIHSELSKGATIEGVHLSGDNNPPQLRISTRRK